MSWGTAGQPQSLRMVESGAGSNGRGRRGSRPRRPSADGRLNWSPSPGMTRAEFGGDTLISTSLTRVAGTPGSMRPQQSPPERTSNCADPPWLHSFASAPGPHHARHKALASGPAASVSTVRRTKARDIEVCRQLRTARSTPDALFSGPACSGWSEPDHGLPITARELFLQKLLKIPQADRSW